MSEAEKIRQYCKAHPGQYFTAEDFAKELGMTIYNMPQRISQVGKGDGFKVKKRKVLHEGRSRGQFKSYKSQQRIAWVGES